MTIVTQTLREATETALAKMEWGRVKKRQYQRGVMRSRHEGKVFLESHHRYQLERGGAPFGRLAVMTGRQARDQNGRFEDKFWRSKVPGERLWRWRLVEKFVDA